jgi:N-formylglutamate amidohydrolase
MAEDGGPDPIPPQTFDRLGPPTPLSPVIVSVPHAGRDYPPALLADAAVVPSVLHSLEDRFADLLVAHAVNEGATAFLARRPRAWIDLNRGEEDIDPLLRPPAARGAPASARARSGLGLIPDRVGRQPLWRTGLTAETVAHRLAEAHAPYHAAVSAALEDAWRLFGYAVLLDCHSMPPLGGFRAARVVIGDRHGRSAAPGFAARLATVARAAGHIVALNAPYAGAYILDRHGQPAAGIHAVQIEIDRTLYLTPNLEDVSGGLERVRALIAALAREAMAAGLASPPLAAE